MSRSSHTYHFSLAHLQVDNDSKIFQANPSNGLYLHCDTNAIVCWCRIFSGGGLAIIEPYRAMGLPLRFYF